MKVEIFHAHPIHSQQLEITIIVERTIMASRCGNYLCLHVGQGCRQIAWETTILLYAPILDWQLEAMDELAVPWSSASMTCRELG
jgi:hypothetical protein